ncbi:MAG: transcriptional repressor LexA [Parcubacteria group bacterium]|nr:transcriptional repressor LexA [Parcubacteria group bacterium]
MPALTKKQKQIYDYLKKYIERKGYSPTFEEIRGHFGYSALSGVQEHINNLVKKGVISKNRYNARGIEIQKKGELVSVSLRGTIAAGAPIEALEKYETITIPKNLLSKSGEHFALRIRGNSMLQEGIFDGDTVIIRKQNTAENGETVVALINDNEATLKKIYRVSGGFKLQPANPEIPALMVKQLVVQGKVVSVMRSYEVRHALSERINLFVFTDELSRLIAKTQKEIKNEFKPNDEFEIWQKTETKPDQDKFSLETAYTFLNELLLLWVCKDKELIDFEVIENNLQLTELKQAAQKIYSHIFTKNIFDWYNPSAFLLREITNSFNRYDFSRIDRDILGKLYEQFITREERKRLGQFYTPEPVIDYILDQIGYTADIEDKKIIDPACGSGGFVTRATKRLIDALKEKNDTTTIVEKVIDNVYGLDVNPFACYLAETNILIQLLDLIVEIKKENPNYKIPKIKIFQTNTMETPALLSNEKQEIKDIKNKCGKFENGFDFVVGNPPYLEAKKMDKKTKQLCAETCPGTAKGAFDLFVCFIDKGLRLLKDNGKFGYIFPNKFLIANYAKNMREELLNNYSIKEIIDISECEVFENVSVYPVILIVENKKPINNVIITAEKIASTKELEDKNFVTSPIKQNAYKRDDLIFFILPSDKKQNSLLAKLLSDQYKTLDNHLTIKWTISFHASGLREKFLFPEKPNSKNAKKLIGGKSFAGNNDINRYQLQWGGWWIDYNEELAKKHKNQLPPKSLFEQEKLIICQNSLRLRAAYDDKKFYCKDTFFVARLNDNARSDFDLKFFLALLNSKLLHYYYANIYKGTHVAGGYLHYLIGYLQSLPIAEPTKKQQSDIVALVEKILKSKNKAEFSKTDRHIDQSVYELYKLTSNEIKIVESFV